MRFASLLVVFSLLAGLCLGAVSFSANSGVAGLSTLDVCSKYLSAQTSDMSAVFEVFCPSYTPVVTSYILLPADSVGAGPYLDCVDRPPVV